MAQAPAIGIDLGSTYSCVGVFQHGRIEIIDNDEGNRITPSYVAFTEDTENERLIGDPAKGQAAININNTIYDAKKLIGRKFRDDTVQACMKHWPFQVINDKTKPKIRVEIDGKAKTYCPEEISSMVLTKMKEIAETYLGKTVENAVISVPTYFNDSQRQSTKDAATIAGLKVLRIINEPSAAAIAYGLKNDISDNRTVLIFDLGGSNLNVSIVNMEDGVFQVISTAGNVHLGGDDFDYRMVNQLVEEFKRKYNKDISQNKKALSSLKTACEQAKRTLSFLDKARIEIDSLYEGIDFDTRIRRVSFEHLNADLFLKTLELVEKVIRDAKMDKEAIDDVVLVGGSSRIPKIQELLKNFFGGKELNKSINPDEAVAYGAAVQAAILNGDKSEKINGCLLLDVTPLSLGISLNGDLMAVVLKRNITLPVKIEKSFTTSCDNQTVFSFKLFEGEFEETKYSNFLGKFEIDGIPEAPAGESEIEVAFSIDHNGILTVSTVDKTTGVENKIPISYNRNGLSEDEIRYMIEKDEEYKVKQEKRRNKLFAKNSLKSYCVDIKIIIEDMVLKKCDETIHWLSSDEVAEKEEYALKQKELENFFNPILKCVEEPKKKKRKLEKDL